MRHFTALLAAFAATAAPIPALAADRDSDSTVTELADRMADPVEQERMAGIMQTMGEILLDLPLAPLAQAAAEMAGEDPETIDPDMTLRQMAPGAGDVPAEIAAQTPRMMRAMGAMASGFERMMPALRDMADRMRETLPDPVE